ncbi:hypothetical protein RB195_015351 [Necator americanus]|uniref:Uncharacterized protein n=1 Tax=Necator americanus TaxID=51031 RepID=A0ABR1E457_NECAM
MTGASETHPFLRNMVLTGFSPDRCAEYQNIMCQSETRAPFPDPPASSDTDKAAFGADKLTIVACALGMDDKFVHGSALVFESSRGDVFGFISNGSILLKVVLVSLLTGLN